jgi:hypothetical protein
MNLTWAILWLIVTRALAPAFVPFTSPARPPADLTRDDVEIMNLCFDAFVNHEHSPFRDNPANRDKKLVVHCLTCTALWEHIHGQVQADLHGKRVPVVLVDGLVARSKRTARTNLDAFRPTGERVVVSDLDKVPSTLTGLRVEQIDPDAFAHAHIWLPAYTDHTRLAIFRFSFGPSSHGATATFVLRKDESGKWSIETCSLAYYA